MGLNLRTKRFRALRRALPLRAIAVCLIALLLALGACRDHDHDDEDLVAGDLTEEENNDRLGRKIVRCGLQELPAEVVQQIEDALQTGRAARGASARDAGSVSVPVVVHVISADGGADNVPDAAIQRQIDVLNAAFAAGSGGSPTAFRFQLTGITRTVNPRLAGMSIGTAEEREAKTALRQGGPETLNLYLATPGEGLLGWATFPWDYPNDPALDGVVISHQTIPGGSLAPYNEGDTLVHEVGHWMGLLHTFQGTCSDSNDTVADTPAEARPAFGCPVGRNSCGGDTALDPINNFMDYSDDFCLLEFTPEQAARMDNASAIFRGL